MTLVNIKFIALNGPLWGFFSLQWILCRSLRQWNRILLHLILSQKLFLASEKPPEVITSRCLQITGRHCIDTCVNPICLSTFRFRMIINFQFICQPTEVTSNKYSHRVTVISQHFRGRWELFFFHAFKMKKKHLREIYIRHINGPNRSPFSHCIIHCVFISCWSDWLFDVIP